MLPRKRGRPPKNDPAQKILEANQAIVEQGKPDITGKKHVIYRGSNPFREDEQFIAHGLVFSKNVLYEVSDAVFEYLKGHKYFILLKGIKTGVIKFPKEA